MGLFILMEGFPTLGHHPAVPGREVPELSWEVGGVNS